MKWRCDEWPHELCLADFIFLVGFFVSAGAAAAIVLSPRAYLVFFR